MYKILANQAFETNHVHYLPSCHSTNEVANDLLQAGAQEGSIIITDKQFAGKGQSGNHWISAANLNLTFSLILMPLFLKPNQQFLITMAISLAIKESLEEKLPGEVKIKWPNDIYFNDSKIAGLLIENVLRGNNFDSCIAGIGININQTRFEANLSATSMKTAVGHDLNINDELNIFLAAFSVHYLKLKEGDFGSLKDRYHQSLLGIDEQRSFRTSENKFIGTIRGTDEFGRLLIESQGETFTFQHKEVAFLI